jgi:hypothetical protein
LGLAAGATSLATRGRPAAPAGSHLTTDGDVAKGTPSKLEGVCWGAVAADVVRGGRLAAGG